MNRAPDPAGRVWSPDCLIVSVSQSVQGLCAEFDAEIAAPAIEVSVVLPCLNERETVGTCVLKAIATLKRAGLRGEVIVADNGSTDSSIEIAESAGARVVHIEQRGYGNALKGGIQAAHGVYVLMADSDDSYDFCHIPQFVEQLRNGSELVMGNRFRGGIDKGAMPFLHRYVGNPVLTALGRLFFHSPCRDFHCGLRAFRKDSYERMDIRSTGMEFASEMVVKASLLQMKVNEVPTTLSPDGRSHPPHLRTWHDGWRHLRFLLMYSPRWLFLYPGAASILLGLAVCFWLLPGPRQIGNTVFDVHTLAYAFGSMLVGFQLLAFAVFTKVFAITEGLLPEDPRLNRLFRYIKLETGLVVGAVLVVLGVAGSLFALSAWSRSSFGPMNSESLLRIVMPSVFALTLGPQVIFSSFFLSILGLRRR
jgi:glycosyltransferase involved in cell wall biosynthesis